jgi:hypothetical protein
MASNPILTAIMYRTAFLLFAGSIELLHLTDHFFVERKDVARLDI